jgi:ketosteroid isomerase-like protein
VKREDDVNLKSSGAIALCVVAAACAAPQGVQMSSELPAMSKLWESAYNSGDLDALAELYSEDCRLLPPGATVMEGRDAVRTVFGSMRDAGLSGTLTSIESKQAGDLGYNVGTYAVSTEDGTIVGTGKFLEVWQRIDGQWKMINDIWNEDPASDTTMVAVTHEVDDVEAWVAAWTGPDSREALFAQHGVNDVRIFTSPDDPKRVGLLMEVVDMEALMTFMATPEVQQAARQDGVVWDSVRFMPEVN